MMMHGLTNFKSTINNLQSEGTVEVERNVSQFYRSSFHVFGSMATVNVTVS